MSPLYVCLLVKQCDYNWHIAVTCHNCLDDCHNESFARKVAKLFFCQASVDCLHALCHRAPLLDKNCSKIWNTSVTQTFWKYNLILGTGFWRLTCSVQTIWLRAWSQTMSGCRKVLRDGLTHCWLWTFNNTLETIREISNCCFVPLCTVRVELYLFS